jgi:hypothetical protein
LHIDSKQLACISFRFRSLPDYDFTTDTLDKAFAAAQSPAKCRRSADVRVSRFVKAQEARRFL